MDGTSAVHPVVLSTAVSRNANRIDTMIAREREVLETDRRVGPSRLSRWSARRIATFWLLWPAIILVICTIGVILSVRVHGGLGEVRLDLTRSNLIGLAAVVVLPPVCLTILWLRMHGRRHRSSP